MASRLARAEEMLLGKILREELPQGWEWHGKVYVGAAHGISGMTYTKRSHTPYTIVHAPIYTPYTSTMMGTPNIKMIHVHIYITPNHIRHTIPYHTYVICLTPYAGILLALLRSSHCNTEAAKQTIRRKVHLLLTECKYDDGYTLAHTPIHTHTHTSPHAHTHTQNFKSSVGSQTDRLVQWCHGAPGVLPLLVELGKHPDVLSKGMCMFERVYFYVCIYMYECVRYVSLCVRTSYIPCAHILYI
ncbi:hypothetical protein EON63_01260 [archaeon]|nr:MAG: hypothetical protein EON63_01260 [archaeon]